MNQIKSAINSIIDLIYPVGFIISTESSTFNPNNLYTGTTWERIKGKVIVGVDEDDTDFASSGLSGGEKEHTLTVSEMPYHRHEPAVMHKSIGTVMTVADGGGNNSAYRYYPGGSTNTYYNHLVTGYTGGDQPHNNMPPFYTAYMWRRTD